jgi:hypothetical protein
MLVWNPSSKSVIEYVATGPLNKKSERAYSITLRIALS